MLLSRCFFEAVVLFGKLPIQTNNQPTNQHRVPGSLLNELHVLWASASTFLTSMVFFISGALNTFLSWRGWIPLSRVSYGMYLVHPIICKYYKTVQEHHITLQENIFYILLPGKDFVCWFWACHITFSICRQFENLS